MNRFKQLEQRSPQRLLRPNLSPNGRKSSRPPGHLSTNPPPCRVLPRIQATKIPKNKKGTWETRLIPFRHLCLLQPNGATSWKRRLRCTTVDIKAVPRHFEQRLSRLTRPSKRQRMI